MPVIRTLMHEGPLGLTRLPAGDGFELRPEGYVDKCHLCYEIREHPRPAYPAVIAPGACYPGDPGAVEG